jgi:hypothetical protein
MSENVSGPSWELLPTEILDKIFSLLPRLSLGNVSLVCNRWKNALHHVAVKYLNSCIETGQIEEKQLERFGWRTSAAWDHDSVACTCVYLAFDFFTREETILTSWTKILNEVSSRGVPEDALNCKILTVMSDKVIYRVLHGKRILSLMVINRLDPGSQPRILELPLELVSAHFGGMRMGNYGDAQIVACDNLLAVMFTVYSGREIVKVFLWNGQDETWLPHLDLRELMDRYCCPVDIAICRNLLAVTVSIFDASQNNITFFWKLNTSEPSATSTQFLGTVLYPNVRIASILMNEKWIVAWRYGDILFIEKAKLFDQNQIAVEAQEVDLRQPLSLWRLMIVNDSKRYVSYVSLEPGISTNLAVKVLSLSGSTPHPTFRILNLATGEIVCQISMDIADLHPVSWWSGNILFLKIIQRERFVTDQEIQLMVFDPSGSKLPQTLGQLKEEATYLLPGPTVKYSGAAKLSFSRLNMFMNHVDYIGMVLVSVEPSTLFIASID